MNDEAPLSIVRKRGVASFEHDVRHLNRTRTLPHRKRRRIQKLGWLGRGLGAENVRRLAAVGWTTWEIAISVSVRSDKAVVHVERFETVDIF